MWFCHLLGGKAASYWMDSPWLNKVKHILSPEPFLFQYDLTFFHSKKRRRNKNLYDLTLLNSVICKSRLNRHPSFPSNTLKQHSPELIFPYWTWWSGWMLISFAFALTVSLLTPAPVPSFTVNSFTLYGMNLSWSLSLKWKKVRSVGQARQWVQPRGSWVYLVKESSSSFPSLLFNSILSLPSERRNRKRRMSWSPSFPSRLWKNIGSGSGERINPYFALGLWV